ncbi:hypothetical protein [Streptomyces sp. NPDC059893]|uniref:hypothetical protein n=1 Tax=Streptomyces sp. NPDC059893 TaxID=3346990 RepID=UPI003647860F
MTVQELADADLPPHARHWVLGRVLLVRLSPGTPARHRRRAVPVSVLSVAPRAPADTQLALSGGAAYDAVRRTARGERKDYDCPRLPVPDGGQADVFRATHKPTLAAGVRHTGHSTATSRVRAMTTTSSPSPVTSSMISADSPEYTVPIRELTSITRS